MDLTHINPLTGELALGDDRLGRRLVCKCVTESGWIAVAALPGYFAI